MFYCWLICMGGFVLVIVAMVFCIVVMVFLSMYLWAEYKHRNNHEAPTVGSYPRHLKLIKQNIQFAPDATIVDLGCGNGGVLRFLHKQYAFSKLVWVDNNRVAILSGKIINKFFGHSSVDLFFGDMQSIDISEYDYVYLFLLPEHLDNIQDWLQKSMKTSAIILCNTFAFPRWNADKEIRDKKTWSMLYIYTLKSHQTGLMGTPNQKM